jgi:hypothetical protein
MDIKMIKKTTIYLYVHVLIIFLFSISFSAVDTRLVFVSNTYDTPSAGQGTLILDVEAISDGSSETILVFQDAIQLDANFRAQSPQVTFSDQRFPPFPQYNTTETYRESDGRIEYVYSYNFGAGNTIETDYTQIVRITIQYEMAGVDGSIDWYTGNPEFYVTNISSVEIHDEEEPIPGSLTDIPLPVELSSFNAIAGIGTIKLSWETESEINNEGFEVYRSAEEEGEYGLLDSYKSNNELIGQGNSSTKHEYSYIDNTIVQSQTYWYKIADVDVNGVKTFHGPISVDFTSDNLFADNIIPTEYNLYQNIPNPFNPSTRIVFDIPDSEINTQVQINIYNSLGKLVKKLYQGNTLAGQYSVTWDSKSEFGYQMPSGVYFARLSAGSFTKTIKMTLLK